MRGALGDCSQTEYTIKFRGPLQGMMRDAEARFNPNWAGLDSIMLATSSRVQAY